jgi:hypothetical protein
MKMIKEGLSPDCCIIVNGHHRALACKNVAMNLSSVPMFQCMIYFEETDEDTQYLKQLALNNPTVPGIPDFYSVIFNFFIDNERMT